MIGRSESTCVAAAFLILCITAPLASPQRASGQDVAEPLNNSRFAEANGIRLQYMDFGGSGLPLIFVQDIHNYFEHEEPFFQRALRSAFYARFTDDHRVLATVKRGYGESDDPGWGYDVATHSEDLLGLMDALGIHRAVLVGRAPATQDLTWIAEHHPERVAGLVYLGNPVVIRSSQHPEARLFDENYARGACDLEERGIALVGARTSWRPHFLDDETVRIDVPALRFTHPDHRRSMDLQRLDRLDAIAAWEPECPGHAQSLEYFRALAADPARRAALREALEASDVSVPIDEGIERAFGASMRTVVEPDPSKWGLPAFHDFIEPHMRSFLEEVEQASSDTVHVAPPTGDKDSDRANVQAAFDAVQPGGTVLFSPGTYLLGAGARLTVPDVNVLGHPDGTVLRGCDPEAFTVDTSESLSLVFGCTGLYVQAERQTVRGLTFEYTWHGIVVGPFPVSAEEAAALGERGETPPAYPAGGQRIEGNTFRATPNGLRVLGVGNERSLVRDNDFIDVFHAIGISGAPLHFLDNRVTVAVPGGVPFSGHTGSAIIVSPGHTDCAGHVVAGNRIDGYTDPIYVRVRRGETCHGVEIRDNTIHAARVKVPEAWMGATPTAEDSTMVGAPITLMNRTEPTPGPPETDREGILEDILVEGNHIAGAEGLGILVQGVSRSRIAGNTIAGIQRRTPFPGITWDGVEQRWEGANGSAIWISPGSDGNEIVGNTFQDIAASAVVIEGDSNRVELADTGDAVRDLGTGNEVVRLDLDLSMADQDSVVSWLAGRAIPIHGVDVGSGFEDLQPLKETLRDVRVIGLGEATHGTHEFFRFKHRLFEFLVREMGVRVLAFEASQSAAENVVDPYVQGGPGDAESVVASLGLVGGWEEVRDLVEWMRAYNQGVPARERVQFMGFDIQYNDEARRIVLEHLRRVAPERVAPTEALFRVPVDSLVYVPYLSRDTTIARTAAEVAAPALSSYRDLYEFVRANEERFATRTSQAEAEHLLRHVRVLDQFADVYGSLLAGSEGFNLLRDRYMAENFRRMLDAQPPDARVAVWAHNLHLMADSSLWNPRPMGRHLRETHGSAYYALGLGLGEGTFMACDIGRDAQPYWALAQFESGLPGEGTVDWYLTRAAERAGARQFVLDLRGAPTTGVVREWLSEPRGMFVVTSVYSPEWGATYASYPTSLATLFDGVAFFQTTTAARPLPLGDCPDQIYR